MTLTLYSMPSSGNSYKVRLLLALLGRDYRHIGMEYETAELAAAHRDGRLPLGKLPVLVLDDGTALPESNAILCYLAEGTGWMPTDPVARAQALGWMFWEQNQHEGVIAVRAALQKYTSRAHLATPERMAELLDRGHALLQITDDHLAERSWFIGEFPCIADIALFAYTHTADTHGGFDLDRFRNVCDWLDRFIAQGSFVALDDIPK